MKMKRVLALILAGIMLLGAAGIAVFAADSNAVATIGDVSYDTLQAALDADAEDIIRLQRDTEEEVTVTGEVFLDLNGHDIAKVNAENGALYVMDSQTSDFVAKTEDDYGVIRAYVGDVQEYCAPEEYGGFGWLMFNDNGTNASFHYVELRVTDMVLQPKTEGEEAYNPNIYYKCAFKADDFVAEKVETFGVALSVIEAPSAQNLEDKCGYSKFTGFQPGPNGNEQNTGTVLKGIMKETNANLINKRNSTIPIYGSAYIQLANDEYVFGDCGSRTLKEQTQKAHSRWTLLNTNSEADNIKKAALKELSGRYPSVMESWDLPDLDQKYNDVVYDASTWYEEFVNLPIVNSNMSEAELRQLVVDAFRLQLSYKWTPDDNFLYLDFEDDYTTIKTGMVYEGTPYCMSTIYFDADDDGTIDDNEKATGYGIGSSNLFKVLKYYDPAAGVLKISEMGDDKAINNILVNNCSGGLFWALGRVSNAEKFHTSQHYTPANGALPVGRVKIDEYQFTQVVDNEIVFKSNAIEEITTFNWLTFTNPSGQKKADFYKSYAELQPGDVLLTDGHVRMCTGVYAPRDENGTLIYSDCYLWYIDQNSYGSTDENYDDAGFREQYSYTQNNGYEVHNLGGMLDDPIKGTKISFQDLLNAHYIPLTIPEFCTADEITAYRDEKAAVYFSGTDREAEWETYYNSYTKIIADCGIEKGSISTYNELETWTSTTPSRLFGKGGAMTANYAMSDFRVAVLDSNGNIVAEEFPHVDTGDRSHSVKINKVTGALQVLTQDELNKYGGIGNRLLIETRLSTGEWITILNANLSKNA